MIRTTCATIAAVFVAAGASRGDAAPSPTAQPGGEIAGLCRPTVPGLAYQDAASYGDEAVARPWLAASEVSSRAEMNAIAVALGQVQLDILEGRAASAIPTLEALLTRRDISNVQVARISGVLGLAYSAVGRLDDAADAYRRSIRTASAAGDPATEAQSRFNAANLQLARADAPFDVAGSAVASSRGAAVVGAAADGATGAVYAAPPSLADVLASYEAAAEVAARAGERLLEARASLYAGRVAAGLGRAVDSEAALSRAGDALADIDAGAGAERSLLLTGIGDAYLQLAEDGQASAERRRRFLGLSADVLLASVAAAEAAGDARAHSFARGALGKLYAANGEPGAAIATTRQALGLAEAGGDRDLVFQWRGQLGDLFRRTGDDARALELYAAAVADVDVIRSELTDVDPISGRSVFRSVVEPIFLSYADLLIAQSGDGMSQPFLRAARTAVDSLKQVELEQYFQDDCISGLLAEPLKKAPEGVAILYPIMLPDRLELLIEAGGELFRATAEAKPGEIATASAELRRALQAPPGAGADYEAPARRLYDWLIAPALADLRAAGTETIVFAPDAALRGVPLNVLIAPDGSYLVQEFATATAISASLIAEPAVRDTTDRRALYASFGLPRLGFAPLPNVGPEVAAARRIFPGPAPLSDDAFTEGRLSRALGDASYDIVHFATHATFGGRSSNSYLLTGGDDGADPGSDGRLTIDEFAQMITSARIRGGDIELITLSACETAAGNDQAILGLAGVAFKSGARSVFASLWAINDGSTADFIPAFYEAMRDGQSKAGALRAAQLSFLAEGSAYRHPYYWSPFILLGEWE